jgi:hypothetical protein
MSARGSLWRVALLLGVVVLATPTCTQDAPDSQCDLVVLNHSRCRLSIYVDGRPAFAVLAGAERTVDDIGAGRHVVEALDADGRLVQRRTFELASGEDFYWTLDTC